MFFRLKENCCLYRQEYQSNLIDLAGLLMPIRWEAPKMTSEETAIVSMLTKIMSSQLNSIGTAER